MSELIEEIKKVCDETYKQFITKLIPNTPPSTILGCRSKNYPIIAKRLVHSGKAKDFMSSLPHNFYEENILHATLFSKLQMPFPYFLQNLEEFLPHIDNWAVCDTTVSNIRLHIKSNKALFLSFLQKCLLSSQPFTVRFGLVSLLSYYLDEEFSANILALAVQVQSTEYYVNMALAWLYSYALIKQYETTLPLFETKMLPKWVHNKSIQKAVESFRLSDERKAHLKTLRKGKNN